MAKQSISDILNTDYKSYARYTVEHRAIPHFADGLKPVQRKILAAALVNCQNRILQVSALTGKVMGDFAYHHGDASCNQAIIKMNQEFMQGMPYLDKVGQFGWLHDQIAGAPRYVKTTVSGWSKLVMLDNDLLTPQFNEDTGDKIEPRFYLPILPMLLINGTDGIAVGYSTSFQNRNPLEVALAVREYLATGKLSNYQLTPFVAGHTGAWSFYNGGFEHVAGFHRKNKTCFCIDGLPINWQIDKYQGYLNALQEQNIIVRWSNVSKPGTCQFEIHMKEQALDDMFARNAIPAVFRLIYRLPKDNLTCIMPDQSLKRFDDAIDVIREFVDFRLHYYVKRKARIIRDIQYRIAYLESLNRFVGLVLDNQIELKGKRKTQLEAELKGLNIMTEVLAEHLYNLTDDNIRKHIAEIQQLQKQFDIVQKTTERQMYIADIDNLLVHLRKFYVIENVINVNNEFLHRIEEPA